MGQVKALLGPSLENRIKAGGIKQPIVLGGEHYAKCFVLKVRKMSSDNQNRLRTLIIYNKLYEKMVFTLSKV